ncbi:hypothetical protein [Pyrodictium delaneyi]|uniref:hypothetical protein n=1 Tax=Pyrodictium delaneyi TaxID=1273541 RepID=UPI001179A674|nr:hypothetical protein [Pyrodictium delaneyi]
MTVSVRRSMSEECGCAPGWRLDRPSPAGLCPASRLRRRREAGGRVESGIMQVPVYLGFPGARS